MNEKSAIKADSSAPVTLTKVLSLQLLSAILFIKRVHLFLDRGKIYFLLTHLVCIQ